MKCLDSDFLVAVLRGDKDAVPMMEKLDEEGGACTTSINAYEILFGAKRTGREENISETRKLISKLPILRFEESASERASDIHADLLKRGQMINHRDIFIAAIAIAHGQKIVTRNIKDFSRIKEIQIEKW